MVIHEYLRGERKQNATQKNVHIDNILSMRLRNSCDHCLKLFRTSRILFEDKITTGDKTLEYNIEKRKRATTEILHKID